MNPVRKGIMYEQVIEALVRNKARKATKFLSEREVIRATRTCYQGRLPRKTSNLEVILTHGRPNYEERQFIRKCKGSLPKTIQFKLPKSS